YRNVTGVQTCALPISGLPPSSSLVYSSPSYEIFVTSPSFISTTLTPSNFAILSSSPDMITIIFVIILAHMYPIESRYIASITYRSEERRVGTECKHHL